MKKDISIPKVKDVFIAAVKEDSKNTDTSGWYTYIINNQNTGIELVIVVSHGYSKKDKTSTLRKIIQFLPKKSYAKLEFIPVDLLKLTNVYKVSYFLNNQLFDKTYRFDEHAIKDPALKDLPIIKSKGILAK